MKVFLLANQPEATIRLKLFKKTLEILNYNVIVPEFTSKNWFTISYETKKIIIKEKPDIVHLFNVPDIIYRQIPNLKGKFFRKLIYDYRSPWGLEYQLIFGPAARIIGEHYEKKLAKISDAILTVNSPLKEKVKTYLNNATLGEKPVVVIPNYPSSDFINGINYIDEPVSLPENPYVLFVGRIDRHEGVLNLLRICKILHNIQFVIVGSGPFSRLYFRKPYQNVFLTGWQPHASIPRYIKKARLCIIPFSENRVSPFITEKGVWKLNEYLNFGKTVIASGISQEGYRKNLIIGHSKDLPGLIFQNFNRDPEPLKSSDYRYWEMNDEEIKSVYETII